MSAVIKIDLKANVMNNVKSGHIILHRSINNYDWSDDAVSFSLWSKLLCMASYKDRNHAFDGKLWELKTGQLVSTYAILGKMVKVNGVDTDKATVRRIINLFCEKGMLSKAKQGNSIVITITNYAQYQSDFFDTPKVTPKNTPYDTPNANNEKGLNAVDNTPKNTPCDTPKITQNNTLLNNTLLNNTLNNNKYMSSDDDATVPKIKKEKPNYQAVLEVYQNTVLDGLPVPDVINAKRKALIDKLFKAIKNPSVESVEKYFITFMDQIKDKPFYFGGPNRNEWRVNFEYVLNVETLTKTREGAL